MRAWTVDADDIRVAEDFDDALLHRTPEIDAFLASDRDDKFIVIGTKGFGKTLLLKAKRILVQREGRAACLPAGSLLDKPIGDKIFGRETLSFFAGAPLPWSKVWLSAIALALLKHARATEGLKVNARLASLLRDDQLHGVIDHFVRLLDLTPSELQRVATDTDGHLVPRLRALKAPVAIFIDGIDEYFNKHVEERPIHPSVTGELSPQAWYFAQLGLVEVAYQLRRINHHLKVFAAIRKEAYAALPRRTAMSQQYRGSAVDIVYPPASLREIFLNNIGLVKADRMVRPARAHAAAGGLPRPQRCPRPLYRRGGGRARVPVPPHAAAPARPDDDRRAPGRAASRGTPARAPAARGGGICQRLAGLVALLKMERRGVFDDLQGFGRNCPDALDRHHLLGWRIEDAAQAAEEGQQTLGGLLDVGPGDREREQQLHYLMVGQTGKTGLDEAFLQALRWPWQCGPEYPW
jgi:hypothetical protein